MLTYITLYYDINRGEWENIFNRTFQKYLNDFTNLVQLFKNNINNRENNMIIYIDAKYYDTIKKVCEGVPTIKLIKIDIDFLYKHTSWFKLPIETSIMKSSEYKSLISHRMYFPENSIPTYTMIMHCKIDFLVHALSQTDSKYLCWVDFGYCSQEKYIPKNFIDLKKIESDRVNFTIINKVEEIDKNINYTLRNAPDVVDGGFYILHRKNVRKYAELYHEVHNSFHRLKIVDDDQHLTLQCFFAVPTLFKFHHLRDWHNAMVHFQKED